MQAGEPSVVLPDDRSRGGWSRLIPGVAVALLVHGGIAWVWSAGMTVSPTMRPPLLLEVVMTPPRPPEMVPTPAPSTPPPAPAKPVIQPTPAQPVIQPTPAKPVIQSTPAQPVIRKAVIAPSVAPVPAATPVAATATTSAVAADDGADGQEGPPSLAPPAPVAEPVRRAARIDAAVSCRLPEYPPAARRAGETGTVRLRFLVDVDGHVAEAMVDVSSGVARLDAAARDALSLCHFQPGTVDGRPERAWARLDYVWKLR